MFGHKGAGDVRGLEEVFRSEGFSARNRQRRWRRGGPSHGSRGRAVRPGVGRPRSVVRLHDPERRHGSDAHTKRRHAGGVGWRHRGSEGRRPQADPSDDGAPVGDADAETEPASGNRRSTRYWTLACVCRSRHSSRPVSAPGRDHRTARRSPPREPMVQRGRAGSTTRPARRRPAQPLRQGTAAARPGPGPLRGGAASAGTDSSQR